MSLNRIWPPHLLSEEIQTRNAISNYVHLFLLFLVTHAQFIHRIQVPPVMVTTPWATWWTARRIWCTVRPVIPASTRAIRTTRPPSTTASTCNPRNPSAPRGAHRKRSSQNHSLNLLPTYQQLEERSWTKT